MKKFSEHHIAGFSQLARTWDTRPRVYTIVIFTLLFLTAYTQPAPAGSYLEGRYKQTESKRFGSNSKSNMFAESNRRGNAWKQRQRQHNQAWKKSRSDNEYSNGNRQYKKRSHQDSSQYLKSEQPYSKQGKKHNTSKYKKHSGNRHNNERNNQKYRKYNGKNSYTQSPYDKFSSDWNRTKKVHRDKWKNHDGNNSVNYDSHKYNSKPWPRHKRHTKHDHGKHRHKHRPNYNIYKRNKYVYYRTPWYSTQFIAPITTHYYSVGYRVNYLPKQHVRIVVGGIPYFYYSGIFYRPYASSYIVVSAPVGAYVTALPVGFIAFSLGLSTYYFVNDTYYVWDEPAQAYVVTEKPEGAKEAMEEATSERLFAYPKAGQSEEQQAKDRYECHRWGVEESGVDPTTEDEEYSLTDAGNYKRAMSACLEGRQYAVK